MAAPLIAAAAVAAAATLAGSIIGANAASDAASKAAEQEQRGLDFQKEVYGKSQENLQPYMAAGKEALGKYQTLASGATQPTYDYKIPEFNFNVNKDPGADYQMAQATRALSNSGLARGVTGGGLLKSIMAKNQEMAGTAYQGAWSRYLDKTKMDYTSANDSYKRNLEYQNLGLERQKGLLDLGQSSAVGANAAGAEAGKQIGASYGQLGSTAASGALGAGSAWTSGLSSLANTGATLYGYSQGLKAPNTPTAQNNNNTGTP